MQVKIFDVEQGNAALITTPTGHHTLLDCGHNCETGFHPSSYLKNELGIDGYTKQLSQLILSHADQDHVSDIEGVSKLNPLILVRNRSIPSQHIRNVKLETCGYIEPAIENYINIHERYNAPAPELDWGGVNFSHHHNPIEQFKDLNDLSLVTFAQYGNIGIVFPGDLSKLGWENLLYNHTESQEFRDSLSKVNIFVASHHGREDGYSEEVFKYCKPDIIIFSDKGLEHETQNTISTYAKHANGISFKNGSEIKTRYVFTTRCDGIMDIEVTHMGNGFHLTTQY